MSGAPPSIGELLDLSGKVAVVTGAARGIGAAIVDRLAEAGASVVAVDIDGDACAATVAALGRPGVVADVADVADSAGLARVADRAVDELGGLHIWVNNAGIYPTTGPALDAADEFVDRLLQVNVRGSYAGAREAARRMVDGGVIVNLASTTAFRVPPGVSAYAVSKHAVVGLTKALAVELGERGIRVLAVAPTVIDTPGVHEQLAPLKEAGVDVERVAAANPLGRPGQPDDVARVVLFCASGLSSLMTGSTLLVDAGTLA